MKTAEVIKRIYEEANKDQPFRKRKKHSTNFLERFEVRVMTYIHSLDLPKQINTDRLTLALQAQAKFAKQKNYNTGQYLQLIVNLIEELQNNPHSPLYLYPEQNELF